MRARIGIVALYIAAAVSVTSAAVKGPRKVDLFWTSPEFAAYRPSSIALLPVATFDNNLDARKTTENAFSQVFHGAGPRWSSALVTREQIRRAGGDSLLKALNDALLKNPRLDSLEAAAYSRTTHSRALLTVRIDQYEQRLLEYDQSGKSTTTIQLHAALVDSTGRLLWTANGSENAEGPYQEANANALGVKSSGLSNQPVTGQGGAPSYLETINKLLTRWFDQFPAKPAPADSTK